MKRKLLIILTVFLTVTGCSKTVSKQIVDDNSFDFEQDYDYQSRDAIFTPSSTGIYMAIGDYFQYYDYATEQFVFLCNKPDCLHNLETDQLKGQQCYAYCENPDYGGVGTVFLQYNNHSLYTIQQESLNSAGQTHQSLMKIHTDGSGWEKVVEFPTDIGTMKIHRGKAYYTDTYNDLYVLDLNTKKYKILNEELNSKTKNKSYMTIYDHYLYIFAKTYNDTNYGVLIKYDIDTDEYKIIGENMDYNYGPYKLMKDGTILVTDGSKQGYFYNYETKKTKTISLDARYGYVGDNYIFIRGYTNEENDTQNVYLFDLEGNLLDTLNMTSSISVGLINDELYLVKFTDNQLDHGSAIIYKLSVNKGKLKQSVFYNYKRPANGIFGSMSY